MSETTIIIHETVWKSYARDAGTFVMITAMIGLGVALDSSAMQWVGATFGFIAVLSRGMGALNVCRMTIPEARKKLDEIEASFTKPTVGQ